MSTVPSHHQWLNDQWLINYHLQIWCLHIIWASLWRRDPCHVGTLWPGYRGVPRHRFYSIFIQFLHVFFMQVSCSFFILYTSTHFLIDWQPGVGILLLHINLCLLDKYKRAPAGICVTSSTASAHDTHIYKYKRAPAGICVTSSTASAHDTHIYKYKRAPGGIHINR